MTTLQTNFTNPLFYQDTATYWRRSALKRFLNSAVPPFGLTAITILAIFALNSQTCFLQCSATIDQGDTALTALYTSLTFAVFLGGWITGLLGVSVSSPLIAREFERQTWDVLATTPIKTSKIVSGRFLVGVWQLRYWFLAQVLLRSAFLILSLSLLLSGASPFDANNLLWVRESFEQSPVGALALCTALVLFILLQPLLAAVVNVALGLFCSTFTRSAHRARQVALVMRVVLWGIVWAVAIFGYVLLYQGHAYEASFVDSSWQIGNHFFSTSANLFEFRSLLNTLQFTDTGGLLLLGLLGLVAFTLVSTWGLLRLATVSLNRHRI